MAKYRSQLSRRESNPRLPTNGKDPEMVIESATSQSVRRARMRAVQGILAALYERERTGKGRLVECSLLETAIGFSSWTSAQWLADHEEPTRQGSRHRQNAPYQRMQTKDGYLMVGAAGEAIWAGCVKALGHPEWCEDLRFATNQQRMANRDTLEEVMNAVLTTKPPIIGSRCWKRRVFPAARSIITRKCSPTHRCATTASCNMRATPNWAMCRTSAPRSRSARVCGRGYRRPQARRAQHPDLWPPGRERGGARAH
jgi:hypothetical protein